MNGGWIKIHRKMRQWQHYKTPSVRMVFEDLLLSAINKDQNYNEVALVAGDAVSSIQQLKYNTGLTRPTIIKAIKILKDSGEITHRVENNMGIYHINNYCLYQGGGGKNNLPHEEGWGKIDLPQGVKSFDHSGKTIFPPIHTRIKNINKNNTTTTACACAREKLMAELLTDSRIELAMMQHHISEEQYRQFVTEIFADWQFRNLADEEYNLNHFSNVLRYAVNNFKRNGTNRQAIAEGRAERAAKIAARMAALASQGSGAEKPPF